MSQGGSTLLCTSRTGDLHWWTDTSRYDFPITTKDCKAAAIVSHPGPHHNSNIVSAKQPNRGCIMTPELVDAGPKRPSPNTSASYILDTMSRPQHHPDGLSTPRELERLMHPLPQRPMPYRHKSLADPVEMKRREVCRNFLAKRCTHGDACHRQHILEGDEIRNVSTSITPNPEHVVQGTTPISPPPPNFTTRVDSPTISSSIRIIDGLYIDRFSRQHALRLDGPSTALPSLSPIDKQSEEQLHRQSNHAHRVAPLSQTLQHEAHRCDLTPTPVYQSSLQPAPSHQQLPPPSSTMPPPSATDAATASPSLAHCPARVAEQDTRLARRFDEVCRLYQTGQCSYGERCFRTHTLALPIQVAAITSLSSTEKVKKPAPPPLSTHTGGVELCKLNLAGKCPRGDGCHYSHDVELPIRPQSRPPSPGPSKTMEDSAVPSQRAGPSIEKLPSPPPTGELPLAAAHPPASEPPQKAYVTLPGHVCRMYFFKRHCAWPSCRFRHCSPEETQAFREASRTTVHLEAQHEVLAPAELPAPVEQDDPVPNVISGEHENEHLRPSESASDGNVQEGNPRRPSNTSKKRTKSRKKKGIGKDLVDETGHDVGKDKAVIIKGKLKVSEEVRTPEDKGKAGAKAKSIVTNANEKAKSTTTNANEKSSVKDKKITTNNQGVDEGGTTSSEAGAPGVNVKHEKGKGKTKKHKGKDEKSKVKDGKGKDKDEKGKEKGKVKEKGKEKETGRRGKGRSSAEIVSPSTELSAPQSSPSPARSSSADSSRSAVQSSMVDPPQSTQRTPVPHAKVAGVSDCVTGARMMELADDGGDTDVEESGSSYYTPRSGTISTQSSWSSIVNSSVSTVRMIGYCFDFVRGECKRRHCRFSHDVPSQLLPNHPNSRSVHHGSSSAPANANVEHNREVPSVSRSVVGPTPERAIRMQQDPVQEPRPPASRIMPSSTGPIRQASEGSFSEPLVPPGLGLDTVVVANAGQSQEGDAADEAVTITVLDSIKVTFSSGFRIVQVNTGFESRQILLEKLPPTVVPADLKSVLCRFGDITTIHAVESDQQHSSAYRVSFSRAESAIDAVEALNGSELFGSTVRAQIAAKKSTGIGGGTLHDGDVLFELPTARQKGYVGYETLEKAQEAIALATQKGMKGMRVTATIYEGIPVVGNVNVRFENLPADATAKDLGRYGAFETHMVDRPKYHWTVNVAVDGLRRMLETHGEVSLNVLPPPYGKVFRVWAHFKDPQAAASAHEALNRFCPRFVGKQRIFAHHVRSIRYNLPADIYDILAHDINLLRSYHYDEHATSISVFDRRVVAPGAPVLVKLVSRNMSSLTKLKTAFDRLLRGEKVIDKGQIVWNDFFGGRTGKEFLDELEKVHPAVKINRDSHRRTLALFGPQQDRAAVRAEIIARAQLLEAQRKHRYTITGNLIGVFMSEDLVILQKDLGHGNVWIDLTHGQLVVCGDADTQKVARLAVQHAGKRCKKRNARGEVGCPVCLGEVSQPVTLACGHTWCRGCLTGYMNASVNNKTFPLTCLGDDAKCSHHIPLSIARQFLSPDEFDAVVNAAFLAHVQSRPSEFQYCPTPDCPQVYRKSGHRGTVLQCPSCLVRICAHCNMEYHESRSCQDRNPEDEKLFETWKMGRDVKDCPSCKVPIERMAGCNHMTCTGCHTHICWACLATFETSGEVYGHMRTIHGGIGL